MDIKQAHQMLDQIKKSGLHNKTKVAQELVRELETYIKSAGMKKQADLRLLLSKRDDDLKKIFFYWASAALSEMTSEPELQGMTIPSVGSDRPDIYGAKILNQLGPMRRRRQASVAKYANFLNNLYEELKPLLISGINKAYGKFAYNNKEFERVSSDILEELWQRASMWAITGKSGVPKSDESRDSSVTPWKRISEKVEGGESIADRVMKAISLGVFSAMASKGRYLSLEERRELGIALVDGQKVRQESIEGQSSSGEEYSKLDQFSAEGHIQNALGMTDTDKFIEEEGITEEELEAILGGLSDGTYDRQPLVWLKGLELLLKSDHIAIDDALITDTLKPDFFAGKYASPEASELARELLELTKNPVTDELEEFISLYYSGELDEDELDDIEGNLIADGWLIDNIEISTEAQQAVEMIEGQAEQIAERAVSNYALPEGKIGDAIRELEKVSLTLANIKRLANLFSSETDNFSWILDANLYLDDAEWALALREADPTALREIQDTIEEHQEPLLPLGLKHIFNSKVFEDKAKIVAIKEFADKCMDQAVVKKLLGNNKGPLGWYLELAIYLNGGAIKIGAGGVDHKIEVKGLKFFGINGSTYNGLVSVLMSCKDDEGNFKQSEVNKVVKALEEIIAPYRPNGLDYKMSAFVKNITNIIDNPKYKTTSAKAGQARKTVLNSGGKLKGFYSGIASELVRYRFYLDIGLTEGSNLPKGLGNADCDERVMKLMGPIPRNEINAVKSETYDGLLLTWQNEVNTALKAREEFLIKKKLTERNAVTKVFKEFGIEEGTELYEAFVNLG
jgi:hypothetical protein